MENLLLLLIALNSPPQHKFPQECKSSSVLKADCSYDNEALSKQDPIKGLKIEAVGSCITDAEIVYSIVLDARIKAHDPLELFQQKIKADPDYSKDTQFRDHIISLGEWVYLLSEDEVKNPSQLANKFFHACLKMEKAKIDSIK